VNNKTASYSIARVIAAMFLVAGTCVGGGMLALPVTTSLAGFWPSAIAMAVASFFMALTGLLFIEVVLWMEEGVHIMTMASRMLGPVGKWVAAILYLFIGYASLIAYTNGGGDLLRDEFSWQFGAQTPVSVYCAIIAFVLGFVIILGNKAVGRVNAVLFIGMILSYALLILVGVKEVNFANLTHRHHIATIYALPLILTIFSYQAIVPSLPLYIGRHPGALRWAIIGGVILAFLIYMLWQLLILGVVPYEGPHGLREAYIQGQAATGSFRYFTQNPWVPLIGNFFALFALVTSFLGIGLGLFDFLADGLHLQRTGSQKVMLTLLIILPTLFFAIKWSRAFLVALETTGGFGDAILNGMIPVLMVWVGRYVKKTATGHRLFGGRPLLVCLLLFALLVFGVELLQRLHLLTPVSDLTI
jgi:tyrosine-specific transport protein